MFDKLLDLLCSSLIILWGLYMGYLAGDSLRVVYGVTNSFLIYGTMVLVAAFLIILFIRLYIKAVKPNL